MTICVMIVFMILSLTNKLDPAVISSVITAVITYYFTKKEKEED